MAAWDAPRVERLKEVWFDRSVSRSDIEADFETSFGAAERIALKYGWGKRGFNKRGPTILADDHPAIVESRTLFPGTVYEADDPEVQQVLVSGRENRKLGNKVTKGRWRGAFIYHLSLEERETCPPNCAAWNFCYGNNLHMARRHVLSDRLMERLHREITQLCRKHRNGILVRLHTVGDFGHPKDQRLALRYVQFWRQQLESQPKLRVFGFTAHRPASAIGRKIFAMTNEIDRCWIRFSDRPDMGRFGAGIIGLRKKQPGLPCPYEFGEKRVANCGACGLCWTMKPAVLFGKH